METLAPELEANQAPPAKYNQACPLLLKPTYSTNYIICFHFLKHYYISKLISQRDYNIAGFIVPTLCDIVFVTDRTISDHVLAAEDNP